jgi:hypothetical protein
LLNQTNSFKQSLSCCCFFWGDGGNQIVKNKLIEIETIFSQSLLVLSKTRPD